MRVIYKVISGSHAYGLNGPNSDIDYRGVCIPDEKHIFGLSSFDQQEGPGDSVIYSLKKFTTLALQNNPNILELLWIPDNELNLIQIGERCFKPFIENRERFFSKNIFKSYLGYAEAQAKRMCSPHRELEKMTSARKELVEKFGYDTKAAMHLFRLLYQLEEIVNYGRLTLPIALPKREKLLMIKAGIFRIEEVKVDANDFIEELRGKEKHSQIPTKPDFDFFEKLVIKTHREFYK